MKRSAWGIVVGGAAAAALAGSAAANATGDVTWTPDYTVDNATAYQMPGSSSVGWDLPASFTSSTGATLTGTDFVIPSGGGYDDVFQTGAGAVYAQDQLFPGFTNLYYDAGTTGAVPVDMMKTPFGAVNLSSLAALFAPDYSHAVAVPSADLVASDTGLANALDLGPGDHKDATWTHGYGTDNAGLLQLTGSSALAYELPDTTFTSSDGTVLTGTDWVTQTLSFGKYVYGYDNEFITNTGALYDQHQLAPDFTNYYYYDPSVSMSAVDFLQTPFGTFNMSWIAPWVYEPVDYVEHATALSPVTDLTDAGLYSVLDLGLPS